jgi:hypothetical protein
MGTRSVTCDEWGIAAFTTTAATPPRGPGRLGGSPSMRDRPASKIAWRGSLAGTLAHTAGDQSLAGIQSSRVSHKIISGQ